jgi:hypothetical protein
MNKLIPRRRTARSRPATNKPRPAVTWAATTSPLTLGQSRIAGSHRAHRHRGVETHGGGPPRMTTRRSARRSGRRHLDVMRAKVVHSMAALRRISAVFQAPTVDDIDALEPAIRDAFDGIG